MSENLVIHNFRTMEHTTSLDMESRLKHLQIPNADDFQVNADFQMNRPDEVHGGVDESSAKGDIHTGSIDFEQEGEHQDSRRNFCVSQHACLNGHNLNVEPVATSNNLNNNVDEMEMDLPNINWDEKSCVPEAEWLGQDEPMALWIKWRGKWQAGIRCAKADCPLPTLKARPTHDRKKYFVVFFPHTRNYSWADTQLVRPIQESPEPIVHRTHSHGLDKVKDLTLPRRFIMQRLAVGMLNVSDKLHNEAVTEDARKITTWKEFAMEASKCEGYSDLGRMLLKLQSMILQHYVDPGWLENSFKSWEQRCQKAQSAEAVDVLKEELVNSVLWNEIEALWDAPVQPELGSEWKTWKQDVMKWFSTSHPMATGKDVEQWDGDDPVTVSPQISRKRPKLEVRRAEMHVSQEARSSLDNQSHIASAEIDLRFFDKTGIENVNTLVSESCTDKNLAEGTATSDYPGKMVDKWDGILVETVNAEFNRSAVVAEESVDVGSSGKLLDSGSKLHQCLAFIEAKGRRCIRWANDGDDYCCVHLSIRDKSPKGFEDISPKAELSAPGDAPMCAGTTTHGTKCKHRSQYGATFCKKHKLQNGQVNNLMDIEKSSGISATLKRSHSEMNCSMDPVSCQNVLLVGDVRDSVQDISSCATEGETIDSRNTVLKSSEFSLEEHHDVESLHCIGASHQNNSDMCPERAKLHTLYCENHLPAFLKRARNGKSRIISKEIFMEFLRKCTSHKQKLNLHCACVLLYGFVKSVLSRRNPVSKDTQIQWILSEASKDLYVGECLMKLLSCEREKLKRLWDFDVTDDKPDSSSAIVSVPQLESIQRSNDTEMNVKCKICSKDFIDDVSLGSHWMDVHKKEARWLFRGYTCSICLNSFTNKNDLETHGRETHQVQLLEQCLLFKCIPCGSHFVNSKQLWLHVLSDHSKDLKILTVAQPHLSANQASQPIEQSNKGASGSNCITEGGPRRFICKFCGLKFDILPDLGRHHQAVHMGLNSLSHPKRGTNLNHYRMKSGRRDRPGFAKGLGAASYRIRNRANIRMKKLFQASSAASTSMERMQVQVDEVVGLGRLEESQCSAVAKSLFSEIQRAKPRPSNLDILSVARNTCCKNSLQASLVEQFGVLPERLYLKAAKLCSDLNIQVEWHQEGFICPNGCKPLMNSNNFCSLMPLPRSFVEYIPKRLDDSMEVEELDIDECHYIIDSQSLHSKIMKKAIVLCEDLSRGLESVPVNCVVDEDLVSSLRTLQDEGSKLTICRMPWDNFSYVTERVLDASLNGDTESSQLGCACPHSTCYPDACDHVYLFDNDYENARDIYGQPMQGRFPYDKEGKIILEEGYLVYECNSSCSCDRTCQNRVLQNGVQVKLEVYKTKNKGWAVRAREAISRGTFVCEYIGEVLNREAKEADTRYSNESCSYMYMIDSHIDDTSELAEGVVSHVIDATKYGNVSRFVNHSCSPNLVCYQVLVESMDSQLAHIGLYASRDIAVGEELAYDYREKLLLCKGQPCYCSHPTCQGHIS